MTLPSIVSLRTAADYDPDAVLTSLRVCLESIGGMSAFISPGQRVLLKPNILGGFPVDRAVTTHPAVVRAAIRLVQEAGGRALVGDNPGVGRLDQAARGCGLAPVIEETGAELLDLSDALDYEAPDNRVARRLTLAKALSDIDALITLPKLKTHGQMTVTGALKNQYGLIPGALKAQWHFRMQEPRWLASLILDVNRVAKPVLAIMDAVTAMEGAGPSGGKPRHVGALLAGPDLAAVDTAACWLIGQDPNLVPLLVAAREEEFGQTEPEQITIIGDDWQSLRVPDFERIERLADVLQLLPLPRPVLGWIRRQWTAVPEIAEGRCTRCGICEKGCPVRPAAIHPDAAPDQRVEERRCIRCYCCHEFCPSHAIDLRSPWSARFLPLTTVANGAARLLGWILSKTTTKSR